MVFAYVLLTSFCILYLGIHWLLDIVGGMLVAAAAVYLSDRYADSVWKILDERTINARLATVLTNPKQAFTVIGEKGKELFGNFSKPTSKETGVILTVVVIVVASVITWDLTHQSLPAGGVQTPVDVAAADGWLVTLDDREMGALLVVHDLSDLEDELEVVQPILDANSTYSIRGDYLAMANSTDLWVVHLENPHKTITEISVNNPNEVALVSDDMLAVFDSSGLTYWNLNEQQEEGPNVPEGDSLLLFESSGDEIAMIFSSNPSVVHIGLVGQHGLISIPINASANPSEDEMLISKGRNVDLENSTIIDLDFNMEKIVATVDVNATTRLVLFDRSTGNSNIISNPIFAAEDPFLGHGVLMWTTYQHMDPINASSKYQDREIQVLDLTTNITDPLTADDLDQWAPMVLEEHYVYRQMNDDGSISVEVQQREASLKPYASTILQIGVVLAIALIFINLTQRQFEARKAD
jgi:hypothetical protein